LSESRIGLMAGSKGDKLGDWMPGACAAELVDAALAGLGLGAGTSVLADTADQPIMQPGAAMASSMTA
jgi:hypothetical protein